MLEGDEGGDAAPGGEGFKEVCEFIHATPLPAEFGWNIDGEKSGGSEEMEVFQGWSRSLIGNLGGRGEDVLGDVVGLNEPVCGGCGHGRILW